MTELNPAIKAIIFDASGTILNDINAVWRANSDVYSAFGLPGFDTLEDFKSKFKMPVPDFHRENGIPADKLKEVEGTFRRSYAKYAAGVSVFPEVKEVLACLRKRGYLLGVASNIPCRFLASHLNELGLDGYFLTVTGQEDCDEQKPSPKPILFTIDKLGVQPYQAMYVGDMEEDMIAGKKAGAFAAGIVRSESYHPRWKLERQAPDYVISTLKDLLPPAPPGPA